MKNFNFKTLVFVFITPFIFASCGDDVTQEIADEVNKNEYVTADGLELLSPSEIDSRWYGTWTVFEIKSIYYGFHTNLTSVCDAAVPLFEHGVWTYYGSNDYVIENEVTPLGQKYIALKYITCENRNKNETKLVSHRAITKISDGVIESFPVSVTDGEIVNKFGQAREFDVSDFDNGKILQTDDYSHGGYVIYKRY